MRELEDVGEEENNVNRMAKRKKGSRYLGLLKFGLKFNFSVVGDVCS